MRPAPVHPESTVWVGGVAPFPIPPEPVPEAVPIVPVPEPVPLVSLPLLMHAPEEHA